MKLLWTISNWKRTGPVEPSLDLAKAVGADLDVMMHDAAHMRGGNSNNHGPTILAAIKQVLKNDIPMSPPIARRVITMFRDFISHQASADLERGHGSLSLGRRSG